MTPAEFFTDSEPEQIVYKANDYFEKIDEEKNSRVEWIRSSFIRCPISMLTSFSNTFYVIFTVGLIIDFLFTKNKPTR